MTTQTEVLKMALEVMRNQGDVSVDEWIATENAIKEALAQQSNEQVEPVAWAASYLFKDDRNVKIFCLKSDAEDWVHGCNDGKVEPLYTHPPVPYVVEPRTAQPKEPAVAEQHKQEPVAWTEQRFYDDGTPNPCSALKWAGRNAENDFPVGTKFYTTPPQRTWVGLTDDEVNELVEHTECEDYYGLVEVTEAKLKEKNT